MFSARDSKTEGQQRYCTIGNQTYTKTLHFIYVTVYGDCPFNRLTVFLLRNVSKTQNYMWAIYKKEKKNSNFIVLVLGIFYWTRTGGRLGFLRNKMYLLRAQAAKKTHFGRFVYLLRRDLRTSNHGSFQKDGNEKFGEKTPCISLRTRFDTTEPYRNEFCCSNYRTVNMVSRKRI